MSGVNNSIFDRQLGQANRFSNTFEEGENKRGTSSLRGGRFGCCNRLNVEIEGVDIVATLKGHRT